MHQIINVIITPGWKMNFKSGKKLRFTRVKCILYLIKKMITRVKDVLYLIKKPITTVKDVLYLIKKQGFLFNHLFMNGLNKIYLTGGNF
jgi:hypothetical protein